MMKEEIALYLENLGSGFSELIPRLILAVVVILTGFFLARITESLIKRLILYLNRIVNERLRSRSLNIDLKRSSVFISRTLFWIIFLVSFLICIQILNLDVPGSWMRELVVYLPNVLAAVVIVFIGIIFGGLAGDLSSSAAARAGMLNAKYVERLARYLILFVAIIIAIDQLGIHIAFLTNLITILVAALLLGASLAFGLGAKTSVSNILGAYYARKSYTLGSTIQIAGITGVIIKITDYAITLETKSGLVVIPAKDFSETKVTIVNVGI